MISLHFAVKVMETKGRNFVFFEWCFWHNNHHSVFLFLFYFGTSPRRWSCVFVWVRSEECSARRLNDFFLFLGLSFF